MSYWDTAALGKLYVQEADSADFDQKAATAAVIVTSDLARFEMHRIAFLKEAEGQIPAATAGEIIRQLESDIAAGELRIFPIGPAIETAFAAIMASCYRQTPSVPLRTAARQLCFTLFPV